MSYGYDISFETIFRRGNRYFKTRSAADAFDVRSPTINVHAIVVDDIYYLATPITLEDDVRARALAKLTPEERAALGIK